MTDSYVYEPMLNLIGKSEGTDRGRGYNETLAYGKLTGGNVNLIGMTLIEIDNLQTSMLAHPANKWNSSALGRYQIVRTTRRALQAKLGLSALTLYNKATQDLMAIDLLRQRGVDSWIAGSKSLNSLLSGLAAEWASLPTAAGSSYYGGPAFVTVSEVTAALNETKRRALSRPVVADEPPAHISPDGGSGTSIWESIKAFFAKLLSFFS